MKTFPFFSVVVGFVFTLGVAQADWVVIQQTESRGKEKTSTIKIKGDKMRMDMGEDMTSFVSADGTVKMFMHKLKKQMMMDKAAMENAKKLASGLLGGKSGEKAPLVATGEKEKVGEWDTEIFTWKGPLGESKFWVAKGFPKFKELGVAMQKLSTTGSNPMGELMPKLEEFPGMVVKSEMSVMGKTTGSHLVSATEQSVDDKEFVEPEGYELMQTPSFNGGLPKGAPRQ